MIPKPLAISLLAAAVALPFPMAGLGAGGLELPPRKPGLWEITMNPGASLPPMSMKICLDPATDRQMMEKGLALADGKCSRMDQSRDGDAIVIDATCDFGDGVMTSRTTISGDLQSSYRLEIVSDREGGNSPLPKHTEMTQDATWEGACGSDMEPGDMFMLGRKINFLNGMKPGG